MKIIVFLFMYFFSGLSGEETLTVEPGEMGRSYKKGMIVNHGEKNGCGWMIEIEGNTFKPKNLSKAFYKDSLNVKLDFEASMTIFKCKGIKGGAQEIYINWMEKSK